MSSRRYQTVLVRTTGKLAVSLHQAIVLAHSVRPKSTKSRTRRTRTGKSTSKQIEVSLDIGLGRGLGAESLVPTEIENASPGPGTTEKGASANGNAPRIVEAATTGTGTTSTEAGDTPRTVRRPSRKSKSCQKRSQCPSK